MKEWLVSLEPVIGFKLNDVREICYEDKFAGAKVAENRPLVIDIDDDHKIRLPHFTHTPETDAHINVMIPKVVQ
jgi:hypothetical protein